MDHDLDISQILFQIEKGCSVTEPLAYNKKTAKIKKFYKVVHVQKCENLLIWCLILMWVYKSKYFSLSFSDNFCKIYQYNRKQKTDFLSKLRSLVLFGWKRKMKIMSCLSIFSRSNEV